MLNDDEGLFLHISPVGKKVWRYRHKIAGTESVLVVGVYPPLMTLLAARVVSEVLRQKVKAGINPNKEHQEIKQSPKEEKEKIILSVTKTLQILPMKCFGFCRYNHIISIRWEIESFAACPQKQRRLLFEGWAGCITERWIQYPKNSKWHA